jgi:hypothetical protein
VANVVTTVTTGVGVDGVGDAIGVDSRVVFVVCEFGIKSMTRLSSSSSSSKGEASGLAMSTAFDFAKILVGLGLFVADDGVGDSNGTLMGLNTWVSFEAWFELRSSGMSLGITFGVVSHIGLSGGWGVTEVGLLVDFDEVDDIDDSDCSFFVGISTTVTGGIGISEILLVGDEGVLEIVVVGGEVVVVVWVVDGWGLKWCWAELLLLLWIELNEDDISGCGFMLVLLDFWGTGGTGGGGANGIDSICTLLEVAL